MLPKPSFVPHEVQASNWLMDTFPPTFGDTIAYNVMYGNTPFYEKINLKEHHFL